MKKILLPPFFIMLAAGLWAIDALFRTQLTFTIPPASIVFFEHFLGFLILSPVFFRNIDKIKSLTKLEWLNVIAMTVVSSTLGTILFTEALARSFVAQDYVTPILLLKFQPIFVIGLSALFLKEKITIRFIALAILALIGSYMISFGTEAISISLQGKELVFLLAIGAAFCWGIGTILSKNALKKLDFPEATALRFLLAIPVALIFAFGLRQTHNFFSLNFDQLWRFVIIASITGGVGSLILYYRGLKYTEAKVSSIAELMFPIVSIIIAITTLNPYGAPQTLSMANIFGIIILLVSILLVSFDRQVVPANKKL